MGKQAKSPKTIPAVWNRLAGKRVYFHGKFDWSVRDRLELLAQAQGATLSDDLNPKVDLLIVQDTTTGSKGIQQQALALNAKGAAIGVAGAGDFEKQITPSDDEIVVAIRQGQTAVDLFNDALGSTYAYGRATPRRTIVGESFAGCDLSHYRFHDTSFDGCDFSGAKMQNAIFTKTTRCNFDRAIAAGASFLDATGSTFKAANLRDAQISMMAVADIDFSWADLTQARFNSYPMRKRVPLSGMVFRNANLKSASFGDVHLVESDFAAADLSGAMAHGATFGGCNFHKANLRGVAWNGCTLPQCDFSGANLREAKLAEADLSGAKFDGADLTGSNLRGAKLDGVIDLAGTKGYDADALQEVTAGPALTSLDAIVGQSKRIKFTFKVAEPMVGNRVRQANVAHSDHLRTITADTSGLQWGWGVRTPLTTHGMARKRTKLSEELLSAARLVGSVKIQFETLDISTHKSSVKSAEMRAAITNALCEAFSQEAPDAEKIGALVKSQRTKDREAAAEARKQREEYKKREEQLKAKEAKKIEKKIEKAVGGKVTDIASFLKALELRADVAKIQKATKMLKAEKFQLFNDITDAHMSGVVKSQTDPDLVYACRIESDGQYACCTQNLNICGGLRGSICKHLLVLIIGLVKAGRLDPGTIDGWVAKSRSTKPELNKETMGEIFIRYKGAEAGEVDWRPTETVPEDYYAL